MTSLPGCERSGETKRVICARCRTLYDSPAARIGQMLMRSTRYCPECEKPAHDEILGREKDAALEAQREIFRQTCPPLYRRLMRAPEFRKDLYDAIVAADPRQSGSGVLLHGATGLWKTTAMWRFIADLIRDGHRVVWETGPGLKERVTKAWKERDVDRQMNLLAMAQFLFLDDLGQAADSPSAGEFLLELIETRTANQRPLLVTMNFDGAGFAAQFNPRERGEAIARRLHDYTTPIKA